ncbi:MAG: MFS transporter [Candidatus Lokiarchaeota archaeon]|nr:MFS transporter [Candidatus Lokiarchaeota archaeon]
MNRMSDSERQTKEECLGEKLSFKSMFSFSLGNMGSALMSGIVYASISFYYTDKLLADSKLIGWGWILFMVWNTINDPIFGHITDNTRHKLGRRIPYIRYGAIFYGISFIFCWYPIVPLNNDWALMGNFLIVLFLFDTMFSIVGTCYYCLPNEMTTDPEERARLGVVNTILWIAAIGIQMAVPLVLLVEGTSEINPMFKPVMIIIAIISSALIFITSFFLKENEFAQTQDSEPFWEGIKKTLKNKPFLIFELSSFSLTLVTQTITTGIFYYLSDVLEVDLMALITGEQVRYDLGISLLIMLAGLLVGAGIAIFKIKTLGVKKISLLSFGSCAVGFAIFALTGMKSIENAYPASIGFFFLTMGAAGAMIILPAVTGDVIDYDELLTGERREGAYAGFNAIVTKPAISLANWAFLSLIDVFGYKENPISGQQTAFAKLGIIIAFTLIPAFFTAITTLIYKWYPLHGEWWRKKKIQINELHNQKREKYKKTCGNRNKI